MADYDSGGWGLAVVAGSHLNQVLLMGMAGSLSVVFSEWAYEFNISIGSASMVLGIVPIFVGLISPLTAALCGRFGCRPTAFIGAGITVSAVVITAFVQSIQQLFCTFVLLSIGISFCYVPSLLILGEYFKKRIVLANALSFLGISIGQLIIPPILSLLIAIYGWRGLFWIAGAIYMHLFVSAIIYRPNRLINRSNSKDSDHNNLSDDNSSHGDTQSSFCVKLGKSFGIPGLCLDPHFMLTVLTVLTGSSAAFGANTFLIPRAESASIIKEKSALLMSCIGIGGLIGRIGHGIIIDRGYVTPAGFFMISIVTASVEIFLIPIFDNYAFLICLSLAFGVSSGVFSPLCVVVPREVAMGLNPGLVTPAIGLSVLVATVGQSLGALLAAILYNATGRYITVYSFLGGLLIFSALTFLPTYLSLRRRDAKKLHCEEDMALS